MSVKFNPLEGRFDLSGGGGGSGDMKKSVYDTNNNGIVDKAEAVDDGVNSTTAAQVATAYSHSQVTGNPHNVTASDVNAYTKTETDNLLLNKEDVSNKVSAWQATPDNTHYPSEKLTKDSIDAVQANLDAHTSDTTNPHNVTASQVGINSTDDVSEGSTNLYYTDTRVSTNPDVSANTSARHTHSNKALLDSLTDTGSGTNFLSDDGTYKAVSTADEKVKASSTDTTAGYLDSKVDGSTIQVSSNKLQVVPGVFANSSHTHNSSDITDLTATLDPRYVNVSGDTMTGDLDFAGFKAIAMSCDNGPTLPTSPTKGQWFLHTPTGRNVLMMYDGSNWIPIMNVGSTTIYVDVTNGTDNINNGGSSGTGAFKTLQYAIDSLGGLIGGDVFIYVAAGTYNEDISIGGKTVTGSYRIYIYGTLTQLTTATSATVSSGSGATQGTVTKTGAFSTTYTNKIVYFQANNAYRIVDSATTNTLTLVSTAPSSTTQTVKVYDWGTVFNGIITIMPGQKNVSIQHIKTTISTNNYSIYLSSFTEAKFIGCYISEGIMAQDFGSSFELKICFVYCTSSSSLGIFLQVGSYIYFNMSKMLLTGGSLYGIRSLASCHAKISNGSIVDGAGKYGLWVSRNGSARTGSPAQNGFQIFRNCNTAIYASEGGQVKFTTNNVYTGNTTDESADSASYSYID